MSETLDQRPTLKKFPAAEMEWTPSLLQNTQRAYDLYKSMSTTNAGRYAECLKVVKENFVSILNAAILTRLTKQGKNAEKTKRFLTLKIYDKPDETLLEKISAAIYRGYVENSNHPAAKIVIGAEDLQMIDASKIDVMQYGKEASMLLNDIGKIKVWYDYKSVTMEFFLNKNK